MPSSKSEGFAFPFGIKLDPHEEAAYHFTPLKCNGVDLESMAWELEGH